MSLYTTLDLSSRAKEVLRDGKHVFNFLVVKIFVPRILAEPLQLTVEMNCLDIALLKGVVSVSTVYHFSVLMPPPLIFSFPQ